MAHTADQVWATITDAGTIHEWFPGIVACEVDGDTRTIHLGSGIPMVEDIITNDPIARRFQYRITGGFLRTHLGTVDVLDLGDETSLVVYSTDAEPDVMALVIGGASGEALHELKRQFDAGERPLAARRVATGTAASSGTSSSGH